MKKIIRQSAIAASLILTIITASFKAKAETKPLVYDREVNPSIGITVENAKGASFVIKNRKGAVIMRGKVKDDKTFFIATKQLGEGTYRFVIGDQILQEFVIQ